MSFGPLPVSSRELGWPLSGGGGSSGKENRRDCSVFAKFLRFHQDRSLGRSRTCWMKPSAVQAAGLSSARGGAAGTLPGKGLGQLWSPRDGADRVSPGAITDTPSCFLCFLSPGGQGRVDSRQGVPADRQTDRQTAQPFPPGVSPVPLAKCPGEDRRPPPSPRLLLPGLRQSHFCIRPVSWAAARARATLGGACQPSR